MLGAAVGGVVGVVLGVALSALRVRPSRTGEPGAPSPPQSSLELKMFRMQDAVTRAIDPHKRM